MVILKARELFSVRVHFLKYTNDLLIDQLVSNYNILIIINVYA
jgi:hypothetical protein